MIESQHLKRTHLKRTGRIQAVALVKARGPECARYEIVAYGFRIGPAEGELLGQLLGETAGNCLQGTVDVAVAMDYRDILLQYIDKVGAEKIKAALEECIVEEGTAVDFKTILKDEGDDLDDTLSLVVNLIRFRPKLWDCVQRKVSPTLDKFMGDGKGDLHFTLKQKIEAELDNVPVEFVRGDANTSGKVDISDAIFTFQSLFVNDEILPKCDDAADANDDGDIDMADGVWTLSFLFIKGSPPPPPPGPRPHACGPDPTDDDTLGCEEYTSCAAPSS